MSARLRILYVDDDRDSLELVKFLLDSAEAGWTIETVGSAQAAVSLIEQKPFDLYLIDYRMPEMSGIELCRYVRQIDAETPVLFFSGMARAVDIAEGLKAGANEYLVKPGDLENLPVIIKRMLEEKAAATKIETVISAGIGLSAESPVGSSVQPDKSLPVAQKAHRRNPINFFVTTRLKDISARAAKTGVGKLDAARFQARAGGKMTSPRFLALTAIFSIIVLHFVFQISFWRDERIAFHQEAPPVQNTAVKTENAAALENKRNIEEKKTNSPGSPESEEGRSVQPEPEFAPSRAVIRKKAPRETRAERLRRAEKLLTGV